jgi:chemotaxis protein MotB
LHSTKDAALFRAKEEGVSDPMNRRSWSRLTMAGVTFVMLLASSCVSQRGYQQMVDQKDAEIRQLREERASLKAEVTQLKSSLDSAQGEIANASAKPGDTIGEKTAAKASEPDAKFPELDKLGINYGTRGGNMVISIPSSITFASGQAVLSGDGQKALKQVAVTLKKQYPSMVYSIEGHTDSDPITKSKFTSNRDLSVQRAMAVLTYMVEDCGIKDDQCIVAGHGQYAPVAPNDTTSDKAKNRRVEIVVQKKHA